jgi:tetratricopeptide (TPR) repeat protein
MRASRAVLLCTDAGSGHPVDDARLAALATLLRRRARTPLAAVVADVERARAAHPDLQCIADGELAAALAGCELVCISTVFASDRRRLERAARLAAAARLAGVPVAVIAADIALESSAGPAEWREILCSSESLSACDAASAAQLAAWRGRRVETVAPPELVLEPHSPADAPRRGRIAIEADLADALDPRAFEALRVALRAFAPRDVVVLGDSRRAALLAEPSRLETAPCAWPAWRRALASCEIVLTRDAVGTAAAALACGAVPVVASVQVPVLARLALESCAVADGRDAAAWARALAAAARAQHGVATRVAPLRALAWRALGPLADALRAVPPAIPAAANAGRNVWAAACAALAAPALAAGDGPAAERILDAWGAALGDEPAWVEARARADALLGRDGDAAARLQRAADAAPEDARVQMALARALVRRGDTTAAAAAWARCAALRPHDPEPCYELAQLALVGGRVDDALAGFAAAQRRCPGHAASLRAVRSLLASAAEREVEFWRGLCASDAEVACFWHQHALASGRAGLAVDAVASGCRALALAPDDVEIRRAVDAARGARDPAPAAATVAGSPLPEV